MSMLTESAAQDACEVTLGQPEMKSRDGCHGKFQLSMGHAHPQKQPLAVETVAPVETPGITRRLHGVAILGILKQITKPIFDILITRLTSVK